MSHADGDATYWIPVRHVRQAQECDFCWCRIPKASPGHTSGSRGTKAYYNPVLRIWECCECRRLAAERDERVERLRLGALHEAGAGDAALLRAG